MKKFSLLLISALVAFSISAQEVQNESKGTAYLKNKGSDNWYMALGAGTSVYLTKGEIDAKVDFTERLGWTGHIELGRWHTPNWGTRLVIDGGRIKHVAPGLTPEQNWVGAEVDIMYNIINAWGSYNPDRIYSLIPYGGVGYLCGLDKDWKFHHNQTLTYSAGLINNFQFSKGFGIFIDLGVRLFQESFDLSPARGYEYDALFTGTAGVKFGLGGKQEFTPAELMDYNLINDLNSQINKLRAENQQLRNKECPECPKCPDPEPVVSAEAVYVPNVVFFRINSAKIDRGQQLSIHNTAEYLKTNPNATVKVVAYADKQTGTPAYNMALSERRAKAVANALINDHGIDSSRIAVEWKGDTVQPYAQNDWNRVAIFFAE